MQIYRVNKLYNSPYPDSIHFRKGEHVTIGQEYSDDPDWKGWIWCTGASGQHAWVPKQFITVDDNQGIFLKEYDARELNLKVGEMLRISEIIGGFGMAEKADGQHGWAPLNHLELISESNDSTGN